MLEKFHMSLYTIVYVSIASEEMSDNDLLAILDKAREHNKSKNITGMLLFRDGFFIQAMEGDEDTLDELFERIKQDERHYNVLQIYKKPIEQRLFPDWAMGFESPNFDRLKQTPGFSDFMHDQENQNSLLSVEFGNEVQDLLETFRH